MKGSNYFSNPIFMKHLEKNFSISGGFQIPGNCRIGKYSGQSRRAKAAFQGENSRLSAHKIRRKAETIRQGKGVNE